MDTLKKTRTVQKEYPNIDMRGSNVEKALLGSFRLKCRRQERTVGEKERLLIIINFVISHLG